jgi:hypothetical protein
LRVLPPTHSQSERQPPNFGNSILLAQFAVANGRGVQGELVFEVKQTSSQNPVQFTRQFNCFCSSAPVDTITSLSSSLNPSQPSQLVTFTAQVTTGSAGLVTGGTVQFFDGSTLLGK